MIHYLLDTDRASLHERGHPPLLARLAAVPPGSVAVSAVTVEEAIRGRLAILAEWIRDSASGNGLAVGWPRTAVAEPSRLRPPTSGAAERVEYSGGSAEEAGYSG